MSSEPTTADQSKPTASPQGCVYLVGAGPGDPGLITMRGVELLRQADLVLYDYLVNPQLLELAPQARLESLGRHGRGRLLSQEEVNARLIAAAGAGQQVVRLKSGDPAVFARAAEEVSALVAAGIQFEIVPGITAALAAGSHAGVPLTHRDTSSAVALITGNEQCGKESPLDYASLAKFPGTLVFYMGVTTARQWSAALLAGGKSPTTPVAIIRRCSWPDQFLVRTTLDHVADAIEQHALRPPIIVIVGESVELAGQVDWFVQRPLFGRRVLVTRPVTASDPLRDKLQSLGAEVLTQSAIEILPVADPAPLDAAIARASEWDWIVFSSAHGVRHFFDRLWLQGDARLLGSTRLAAIGPGTAAALEALRLRCDLLPSEYRAESLVEALAPQAHGKRVLLIRASRGRETLAEGLRAAGATVEQIVAYESRDTEQPSPEVLEAFDSGRIDTVTVTSSAIARSLVRLFGERLHRVELASLSPLTSQTLRELGFAPSIEAATYTMDGLAMAIATGAAPRSQTKNG